MYQKSLALCGALCFEYIQNVEFRFFITNVYFFIVVHECAAEKQCLNCALCIIFIFEFIF